MSDFDNKLKEIVNEKSRHYSWGDYDYTVDVKGMIKEIKQLISEVVGEDEGKKVVPPNKNDSYESLNAQFKVMKYNQEQIPIRNELRKELRHAFNIK